MGGLVSWFRRDEEVRLENDGTFATENVTVMRGICHFKGRTIIDRHTITMSNPCAEATCWAPLKVVLLTKSPSWKSIPAEKKNDVFPHIFASHGAYFSCRSRQQKKVSPKTSRESFIIRRSKGW
uniref:8.9 kDa family member n=1 Tax=Rhipicephalus zambeziensis TaxID=60191 RepID=A0A224Y756_9ACAR